MYHLLDVATQIRVIIEVKAELLMFGVNCTLDLVLQSQRRLFSSDRDCSVGQEISKLAK